MNIVNLTPHEIKIVKNKDCMVINPSGTVVRCEQNQVLIGKVNGVDVYKTNLGEVKDLPNANKDTVYITSIVVAQAVKDKRNDVLVPFDIVRDEKGVIIGCKSLAQV